MNQCRICWTNICCPGCLSCFWLFLPRHLSDLFFNSPSFGSTFALICLPATFLPSSFLIFLCIFSPPPLTATTPRHAFIWPHLVHILISSSSLSFVTSTCFLAVHRRSPIWEVSKWARRAVASSRLCSLAQPRSPAPGWQHILPLPAPVSNIQSGF